MRVFLAVVIILVAATWWPTPAAAQLPPDAYCPSFLTATLTGGQITSLGGGALGILRIGQGSQGIYINEVDGTNPESVQLPVWPQYRSVNNSIEIQNTTSLSRAYYYCWERTVTPTPSRTATVTPSTTPTGPTATAAPEVQSCENGDIFCQYGVGTQIALNFSTGGMTNGSPVNLSLTADQASKLAEPGAWRLQANCTRTGGVNVANRTNQINLVDPSTGNTVFSPNVTIFSPDVPVSPDLIYHVAVPPITRWDYAQRSFNVRIVVGTSWSGDDSAQCSVVFTKQANNNVIPVGSYMRYRLYNGRLVWGRAELPFSTAYGQYFISASWQLDTGWTVANSNTGIPNPVVIGATTNGNSISMGTYPTFTNSGNFTHTGPLYFALTVGNINKADYYLAVGQAVQPTATNTRTPTSTRTPTLTPTGPIPTATITQTPTVGRPEDCAAPEFRVPVAPLAIEIPFTQGGSFVVSDASVFVNIGGVAQQLYVGTQTWSAASGTYTVYSVSVEARILVCVTAPLPTNTLTPTFANTPIVGTPDIGGPPPCVAAPATPAAIAFSMPDLSLVVPTLRPLGSPTPTGTVTVTVAISTTAVVQFFGTVQAGISTPAAAVATVSASYSWQSGAQLGATSAALAGPALDWLAIANPQSPAWTSSGGPLWALAPVVMPVLPIVAILLAVVLIRFLLWLVGWFLKLVDLVIKLIELIPGM